MHTPLESQYDIRISGKLLLIYICNFHVLSNLLLIYICKLHWNSHKVSNGVEAIALLKLFQYDMILTDVYMPSLDGYESSMS